MQLLTSTSGRSRVLLAGLFVIMSIFIVRLFYLQVIRHDYFVDAANALQMTKLTINPERGSIFALDGENPVPLVLNQSVYTVFADPSEVEEPEKIASTLRNIAGGNVIKDFENKLDTGTRYEVLGRLLNRSQAELIKKADLRGIGLQENDQRVYPENALAGQVLGYVNASEEGQYGIEEALDARLRGEPGTLQTVTDVRRIPLTIGQSDTKVSARDGDDLVLTIDRNIQARAEQMLRTGLERAKASKGSIIIMDPRDGSIKAMANLPSYSPADYSKVEDYAVFQNNIVSQPYEAGSVLKTLTMGAALDSGAVRPSDTFNNTGAVRVDDRTIRNVEEDPIDPAATMTDILRYSLNTGVVYALQEMGGGSVNRQARDTLYSYFHDRFHLGQKTGIEQAGEAKGTIIAPSEQEGNNVRYANMTFGQGMDVTMIQSAAAFSGVINGGTLYQPRLVAGTLTATGAFKKSEPAIIKDGIVSSQSSNEIREMIHQGRKQGFFGKFDRGGYIIGGKTGTSQVIDTRTGQYSDENSIGTYLGFGGVDTPEYVIMVKVDDSALRSGYEGTTAAGPIFNDMSSWMLDYLQLQPRQ